MNNKYLKPLTLVVAFLILTLVTVASYAYFTASVAGNTTAKETVITTGNMALTLIDGDAISLDNAVPGSSVTKTFKVKNTGTVHTAYDIYFSELFNNFEDTNDLVYTITSENGCTNNAERVVPSEVGEQSKIISTCSINTDVEHEYTLTITFKDDQTNQDDNKGKKLRTKININEYKEYYVGYAHDYMIYSKAGSLAGSSTIESIEPSLTAPTEEDNAINVAEPNSDYPLYLWFSDGKIKMHTKNTVVKLLECDSIGHMSRVNKIDFSIFDTSLITNMSHMFEGSGYDEIIFGDNFDTSNVTDMSYMFNGAAATKIDFGNKFNPSNVTNMTFMFSSMRKIEELDLGKNFDTSNVINMNQMFANDQTIRKIDLGDKFDTSKVTDMHGMFYPLFKLEELDLGDKFYNTNVTDMSDMFNQCKELKELDLSHFYTPSVLTMENMFAGCNALKKLDLRTFNTSKVTNMHAMFNMNSLLDDLDISSFDTSKVTDMGFIFAGCTSLANLDVSNFDTSNVENMQNMFGGIPVTSLDISSFDTRRVENMSYMFNGMRNLKTIYVSNKWNTISASSSSYMFDGCTNIEGSQGTTYNSSYINKTYAHVDGGTSNPGYFTLKSN